MLIFYAILVLIAVFCGVIGALVVIYGLDEESKPIWISGIVICAIAVVALLCFIPVADVDSGDTLEETIPLYALGSASGVSGTFIFGSGSVKGEQYYIGYTEIGGNSYKQVQIDADKSILKLNDEEEPRIEKYYTSKRWQTIFPFIQVIGSESNKYLVYIPTNGLSNTFEVN